jgi:hypothetical protein
MWADFVQALPKTIITLLSYFAAIWGDSMLGYFGAHIAPIEDELGVMFSLDMTDVFFRLSWGQYICMEFTSHVGIVGALVIGAARVPLRGSLMEGKASCLTAVFKCPRAL